jgi:hypothetical protein
MGAPFFELAEGNVRNEITFRFGLTAEGLGYQPTFLGADRHGSFIWEAARMDRFVRSLAVSFTPVKDSYLIDAWASGSDGERFAQSLPTPTLKVHSDEIYRFVRDEAGLAAVIGGAANAADGITELRDRYSLDEDADLAPKAGH